MTHHYGWRPDLPDHRDHFYSAPAHIMLPSSVDLRSHCPVVYDQGELGSCTANAIAGALEFDQIKQGDPLRFTPSRLFIYYNERAMEHTTNSDSGAAIRDGVKSVNTQGACMEDLWPYEIAQFATRPTQDCYTVAAAHKTISYQRVARSLTQFKTCLASGYPFVFGFSVYASFESEEVAWSGKAPMPGPNEELLGGHAVLCVGYDEDAERFLCRNSWGTNWGMQGYFTLPYAYLTDHGLSSDFWTIRAVEE